MRYHVLLPILCLVGLAKSQDSSATRNEVAQRVQRLMDVEVSFEKMVPPGTSIETREISRKDAEAGLVVQYHIFVKGVPPDTLFQYINWPVSADKPSSELQGISLGENGILTCAGRKPEQCGDPKKPDDPIEFTSFPKKGEPVRMVFVSPNIKIGTVIVPDPIEGRDRGCTLGAVRLTPKFELAFLSGAGYPPNSDVHYRVSSEKVSDSTIKSDSTGTIRFSLIPYAAKKNKGTVTVQVTEARCSPEVSFEWGTL